MAVSRLIRAICYLLAVATIRLRTAGRAVHLADLDPQQTSSVWLAAAEGFEAFYCLSLFAPRKRRHFVTSDPVQMISVLMLDLE